MAQRIWTISNGLSFLRILLVIPIAILLFQPGSRMLVAGLLVFAALTDLLDGYLARIMNEVSEFGKIIDPLADKIAVGVVCLILMVQGKVPFWFFLVAVVRDLIIFLGGVYIRRKRGVTLQSNMFGKWTVTSVAFFVLISVVDEPSLLVLKEVLMIVATVMLFVSFWLYGKRFFEVNRT